MKFLCGRPGCGQESTATLQIDAVASTVSLVDPRTSRDGVPLCARHADSTTPPLGWAMNDLRSTSQAIDHNEDASLGISATPPRVRPDRIAERGVKKMSRRQSIAERARQEAVAKAAAHPEDHPGSGHEAGESADPIDVTAESRPGADYDEELVNAKLADRASRRAARNASGKDGPDSRPARRRDIEDGDTGPNEDGFPWNFQFNEDDEPEELQASSPLLSRAFRATTG